MIIFTRIEQLENRLSEVEKRLRNLPNYTPVLPEYVECEKCGCLLKGETAYKGKGEVKNRTQFNFFGSYKEDYIYYPYYCKIHKPKDKNV